MILWHCIYHSDGKLRVYTSLSMVCVLSRGKHGPPLPHLYTFSSSCQALCLVNIHKHRYTSSFCILKLKSDVMFQKGALNSHQYFYLSPASPFNWKFPPILDSNCLISTNLPVKQEGGGEKPGSDSLITAPLSFRTGLPWPLLVRSSLWEGQRWRSPSTISIWIQS